MPDWTTTFNQYPPGPTRLIGSVIVRVADWSRPRAGRALISDSVWLDRLTCAHPGFVLAVYGPAGIWLVWRSAEIGVGIGQIALCYAAGLFAWTLLEYVVHRVSFHHAPTSPGQVAYGYLVHGVHHAYPDDSRRWVLPLVATVPIAIVLFCLFTFALGRFAAPAFAGFMHGYLTYDLLHYVIHRGRVPTRLGRYLRQYHLAHHYATPDRHFGVSSPLWDVVFRTR
jgi:sterol desaturase/sphingolipid hydroxylase (fatty acid hydroxylase superfamily)